MNPSPKRQALQQAASQDVWVEAAMKGIAVALVATASLLHTSSVCGSRAQVLG